MPVDDQGCEAGDHTSEHEVKDDAVAVGHFEYEDGGGKGVRVTPVRKPAMPARMRILVSCGENSCQPEITDPMLAPALSEGAKTPPAAPTGEGGYQSFHAYKWQVPGHLFVAGE